MGLVALIGWGMLEPTVAQYFLTVRDVATGSVLLHAPSGRGGAWFSPNGRRLVLGYGATGFAESYDLERAKILADCRDTVDPHVGALSVSPRGTFLATGGGGWSSYPRVEIRELSTGRLVHEFRALNARVPLAVHFLDEDRLVVATKTGTLHVLSVHDQKELQRFDFVKNGYYGHLSAAGDYVLAGTSEAKTMGLYRL